MERAERMELVEQAEDIYASPACRKLIAEMRFLLRMVRSHGDAGDEDCEIKEGAGMTSWNPA